MKADTPRLVDIAFRTEDGSNRMVERLIITISHMDYVAITEAQKILANNKWITSVNVPVTGDVTFVMEDSSFFEQDGWQVDTGRFTVYEDCFYYYAQNKWYSGDQLESESLTLTK